ncbi:MAG: metal-dependent hydrolase [Planctomycetota bacterium]|nr:metal-dependent hydrolase [Planctomycetota bacterium]
MANFHMHIGTSTVLGIGIGVGGYVFGEFSPVSCALAGGLCGISGMLPDVDSENGIPLRETMTFLASVVPMMIMDGVIKHYGAPLLEPEARVLAAGGMYLFIRFVFAEFIRRTTVHRGMWHSIPAAGIAGLVAFFLCPSQNFEIRMFKVFAVALGFLSHLVLDELYSVEPHRGRMRVKRSFGTALKLWSSSQSANIFTYGILLLLTTLVFNEPIVRNSGYATEGESPVPLFEQLSPRSYPIDRFMQRELGDDRESKYIPYADPATYERNR